MQLGDLTKPISDMTDEELHAKIRELRNNRTNVRPAAKAHAKRAERKGSQARVKKAEKLLEGLSREELLKLLGG